LRTPDSAFETKKYPFRTSFILRDGTWWIIEHNEDIRKCKTPTLAEEAKILVTFFMPLSRTYSADIHKPTLTPELLEELMEHILDPINGSNGGRKRVLAVICLHVDDLFIVGVDKFVQLIIDSIKKEYTIGHQDKNDIEFTGQRVKWHHDAKTNVRKFISIDQDKNIETLAEVEIPKVHADIDKCDPRLHTEFRSGLGSLNWLQSRTQFQTCFSFSRLASCASGPTIGELKALNKLTKSVKNQPVRMMIWPLKGTPRIVAYPDAAYRNNSDKSSQRAQVIFFADERNKSVDSRGSMIYFESTKIKRTTLSTTVAELYALMKSHGTCQMLRGLWKDISGLIAPIHIRTDANNLVTTASTTHIPEQQETIHMIQMLRREACSGAIDDLAHVRSEDCLSDSLTKASANPASLIQAVNTGTLPRVDTHPPFRSLMKHKAYLVNWLIHIIGDHREIQDLHYCGEQVCSHLDLLD
jgi:hypothetical protein